MVEYDSPEHRRTAQSLARGIPAIATPLGYNLFLAGCGASFKDWHFAEGGLEGPRKLQGNKALNSEYARLRIEQTTRQLATFLKSLSSRHISDFERSAQAIAVDILNRFELWRNKNG